jgi:hypothetical protein
MEATAETYWVRIHIAGPIELGKQVCREYCLEKGLCVTVTPTTYIYTGGEEAGYIVELINYPRFPVIKTDDIDRLAKELACKLRCATFQHSFLVMSPRYTYWHTNRQHS